MIHKPITLLYTRWSAKTERRLYLETFFFAFQYLKIVMFTSNTSQYFERNWTEKKRKRRKLREHENRYLNLWWLVKKLCRKVLNSYRNLDIIAMAPKKDCWIILQYNGKKHLVNLILSVEDKNLNLFCRWDMVWKSCSYIVTAYIITLYWTKLQLSSPASIICSLTFRM